MDRRSEEDLLTRYYIEQTGHGGEIYRGQLYQKGIKIDKNLFFFSRFF